MLHNVKRLTVIDTHFAREFIVKDLKTPILDKA